MPVSVNMPNQQRQADPLEKLENALNIAKAGFGIVADMKAINEAKLRRADDDKLKGLQIKDLESKQATEAEDNNPNSLVMATIREAAKKRGITLPEGTTPKQARTNFDAFLKPNDPKQRDPLAEAIARQQLAGMKDKQTQVGKRDKEFGNRFKNINTQIANLDKLVKDDGTAELFGDHEKKLQQTIDSIAIDSAKLFDPESVARESEVAAFRNMLFAPGDSMTADSTARGALENYKKLIQSRAENEGLAHLLPQDSPVGDIAGGGQAVVPKDIQSAAAQKLAQRRAQARK